MLAIKSLVILSALSVITDIQLLQFTSRSCVPCQTMEPVVGQFVSAGYPIRKVDVDQEPDLATRFGVRGVPCFVMLVAGQEVDRVEGATSLERLQQMFATAQSPAQIGPAPRNEPVPHNETDIGRSATDVDQASPTGRQSAIDRCVESTVRLKIEDAQGHSYGSGTVVDMHGDEALIVTCGHIFRESQGRGRISVDLFAPGTTGPVEGRVISYDLDRDIALVAIRPGMQLSPVPVAGEGLTVNPGERIFSVGCDRGGEPRSEESRVVAVNRYLGPANFVISGRPVDGRSGGGLFTSDGRLIGVCNAADALAEEGLFAALPVIHTELEKTGLAFVYQSGERGRTGQPASSAPASSAIASAADHLLDVPARRDRFRDVSDPGQVTTVPVSTKDAVSPRTDSLAGHQDDAEVVCIVRSRNRPGAPRQVIVLQQPSGAFLTQLSTEARNQDGPRLTDLRVPRRQ